MGGLVAGHFRQFRMGTEKHKHASKREAYAEVMVKNNIFYEITGGKTTFITMLYWHRIVLFSLILIFLNLKMQRSHFCQTHCLYYTMTTLIFLTKFRPCLSLYIFIKVFAISFARYVSYFLYQKMLCPKNVNPQRECRVIMFWNNLHRARCLISSITLLDIRQYQILISIFCHMSTRYQ